MIRKKGLIRGNLRTMKSYEELEEKEKRDILRRGLIELLIDTNKDVGEVEDKTI